MNSPAIRSVTFDSPEGTSEFAAGLGELMAPGDVVLLSGPVGAGKSHFARSLIQTHLKRSGCVVEDVPSPTFTLVQTYHSDETEIWHADLYRLTHTDEVEEIGLMDAFDTAICLVEWPDRLGDLAPSNALSLTLEPEDADDFPERRVMTLTWQDPKWTTILEAALRKVDA